MHTYLNIDRVLGFPIQPMGYSSESEVSDWGVKVRLAIHHYPPVKPMIIEAPEMILELRATVDSNGRMEYQFSNYFANPTDLKALAKHLPRGSDLVLMEDGALNIIYSGGNNVYKEKSFHFDDNKFKFTPMEGVGINGSARYRGSVNIEYYHDGEYFAEAFAEVIPINAGVVPNYYANISAYKNRKQVNFQHLNMSHEWGAHFYSTVCTQIGYGRVLLPTSGDVQIRIVIGYSIWHFPNGAVNMVLYKYFFNP
jgi:hypothetical protein